MKVSTKILNRYRKTIPNEVLQIIVFEAVGCSLGVDTEQVIEILNFEEAKNRQVNIIRIEDNMDVGSCVMPYRSPKVLIVKEEEAHGILVNEPKDIIDLNLNLIHPLPPLIAKLNQGSSIWGASFINNAAIYLMDFYKLLKTSVEKKLEIQITEQQGPLHSNDTDC